MLIYESTLFADWIPFLNDFRDHLDIITEIIRRTKGLDILFLDQFSNRQLKTYLDRLESEENKGLK